MTQDEKYQRMIDEAREAIQNSSESSSVYIGCDSKRYKKQGKWKAKYSTVVIVHKDSRHGCQIFYHTVDMDEYDGKEKGGNIKMRMMNEAGLAVQTGLDIIDIVGDRHIEIHLDINPNPIHKSSIAIKEAIGWVRGSLGIDPHVKPDGWAATHAADHAVRHLQ